MTIGRGTRVLVGVVALLVTGACDPPDPPPSAVRLAASDAPPPIDFPAAETGWPDPDPDTADPVLADTTGEPGPEASDPVLADTTGGPEPVATDVDTVLLALDSAGTRPTPGEDFPNARFPRPDKIRGLYVNAWAAGSGRRIGELLDIARETEVNAMVIDIKDATGFISHHTEVELAHTVGATDEVRIADLPGLLDRLEAEGIYPIARIVIVKDPILTAYRPELAIQDTAGGVWVDSKGITWLNPYDAEVWRYHVDIAQEVAEMGFPEIQWDYVRFPDAPKSDLDRAVFRGHDGRERYEAIRGFLAYARSRLSELPVRSTADVFGVTTSYEGDIGTGQVWEHLIDVVDVALPMVYPSHYWEGSFGHEVPNARPYEIVRRALEDAVRRSRAIDGAGLTRPWLQDFSLGEPSYAAAEVRAQIQATYDAGVDEWVLWNPGSRYTVSALEPVAGFEREPWVRVAGVLAPVSRRQLVIDSIAALPPEPESAVGASPEPESGEEPLPDAETETGADVGPSPEAESDVGPSPVEEAAAPDSAVVSPLPPPASDTLSIGGGPR